MESETEKILIKILNKLHTMPCSLLENDKKLLDNFSLEGKITEQHAKEILESIEIYRNEILREIRHVVKSIYLNYEK